MKEIFRLKMDVDLKACALMEGRLHVTVRRVGTCCILFLFANPKRNGYSMPPLQDLGSRGNEAFLIHFVFFCVGYACVSFFFHCQSRCTTVFFSQNIGFSTVHLMSSVRNPCWLMIIDYYGGL